MVGFGYAGVLVLQSAETFQDPVEAVEGVGEANSIDSETCFSENSTKLFRAIDSNVTTRRSEVLTGERSVHRFGERRGDGDGHCPAIS